MCKLFLTICSGSRFLCFIISRALHSVCKKFFFCAMGTKPNKKKRVKAMSINRKSIMFCSWKCMGGIVGWYTTTVYALWHPYMQLHELLLLDLSPSIFAWSHTSAHTRNADTQFAYTEHVSNSIKWFYIQWMDETKKKSEAKNCRSGWFPFFRHVCDVLSTANLKTNVCFIDSRSPFTEFTAPDLVVRRFGGVFDNLCVLPRLLSVFPVRFVLPAKKKKNRMNEKIYVKKIAE